MELRARQSARQVIRGARSVNEQDCRWRIHADYCIARVVLGNPVVGCRELKLVACDARLIDHVTKEQVSRTLIECLRAARDLDSIT